jgi:hypothetical protein
MLDSLVRVSRRVEDNHFVCIANPPSGTPNVVFTFRTDRTLFSHALGQTDIKVPTPESGGLSLLTQQQWRFWKLNESEETHQLPEFLRSQSKWCWPFLASSNSSRRKSEWSLEMTGWLPFPVNNFKYFLTLFSKFFSSFPHGTCSLSVSRQYLALDELYHPFSAALPSNATLRKLLVRT